MRYSYERYDPVTRSDDDKNNHSQVFDQPGFLIFDQNTGLSPHQAIAFSPSAFEAQRIVTALNEVKS